jgi:hypothetical protein
MLRLLSGAVQSGTLDYPDTRFRKPRERVRPTSQNAQFCSVACENTCRSFPDTTDYFGASHGHMTATGVVYARRGCRPRSSPGSPASGKASRPPSPPGGWTASTTCTSLPTGSTSTCAWRRPACALVIVGVRADGTKELVAISDGYRESTASWADVLRDLKRRGMRAPVVPWATGPWGCGRRCGRCSRLRGPKDAEPIR